MSAVLDVLADVVELENDGPDECFENEVRQLGVLFPYFPVRSY